MTTTEPTSEPTPVYPPVTPHHAETGERADLLQTLTNHRFFLRNTLSGMSEEQIRARPTVSELTLGGLLKHVSGTEESWTRFMHGGAELMESVEADWEGEFRVDEGQTVESLLAGYEEVARKTDEAIATLDLDRSYPLPEAPWFPPGASWSVRRVALHLIAEISQHAGHADIIRETIDGRKSMG